MLIIMIYICIYCPFTSNCQTTLYLGVLTPFWCFILKTISDRCIETLTKKGDKSAKQNKSTLP